MISLGSYYYGEGGAFHEGLSKQRTLEKIFNESIYALNFRTKKVFCRGRELLIYICNTKVDLESFQGEGRQYYNFESHGQE